ncbi:MAG: DsbA family protein [Pseudomonadota bacterium]
MIRTLTKALAGPALAVSLAAPVAALDLENMSDAERQILREEIRNYLLDNPDVIMEAVAVLEQRDAVAQANADEGLVATHAEALFNDSHSWKGGNLEGDITLVEFIDYRCGFCRRAAPDVEQLVNGDGNIRIIVKEFPILGEQSLLASRFAISALQSAGDDAYKAVHDALLAFEGEITERSLTRLANALGLDGAAIVENMSSPDVDDVIAANHNLGRALQINGTPSFVMENRLLRGFLPLDQMQALAADLRQ